MIALERKFQRDGVRVTEGTSATALWVEGYASLFDRPDRGGDVVVKGAFSAALARLAARGERVRMLWQHDQTQPIGVWDEVVEDNRGLRVKGRILTDIARGREAAALVRAGAVDGLSIGYRTRRAEPLPGGGRRLVELELWEVSLVTFPMLPEARLSAKAAGGRMAALALAFERATAALQGTRRS